MKNVVAGANPMVIKKGIQKAVDAAIEAVKSTLSLLRAPRTLQE